MMAKRISCLVLIGVLAAGWGRETVAVEPVLPVGSEPPPIVDRHFPSRVHAFIWRNWDLVDPAQLAKILRTSEANVNSVAASMGLPPASDLPAEMKTRGYMTLLRRNWHLLPYEQLLELLEVSPERLAFALYFDDGVFWKLGSLKPKCEPLRYQTPDDAAQRRAAEIRRVVESDFGRSFGDRAEPRFAFVRELSRPAPSSRCRG